MAIQNQLLAPVMQQESGGNPNALSPKGAAGAYQIMPATARDPGYGVTPLQGWDGLDPRTAPATEQARFANDYLNAMQSHFGGDVAKTLAAYNAGPGAVEKYNGVPPYEETQNYVKKVGGSQVADNTQSDWRSRAEPVQVESNIQQLQPAAGGTTQQPGNDWRSRAVSISVNPQANTPGTDMGAGAATVQGFNSAVPFGERIAAGLGATGSYVYDKAAGLDAGSLGDYYKEARQNQDKTAKEHSGAYLGGAVTGLAATLPVASAKVLTGTKATTGIRGAVNAVPEMLGSVGNFVRGGQVAEGAGTVAKATSLAGKALRSAVVAAPAGAVYSYGASKHDLNTPEAAQDAVSGAKLAAAVGGALPVAGAAVSNIVKPVISKEVKALAERAKNVFGIDLSLDQVAPGTVRDTVQKISQAIPGSGVESFQAKQSQQWHSAIAKEIGQNADNLGPETINKFLDDASSKFEAIVKHTDIKTDIKSFDALQKVASEARNNITKDYADLVANKASQLANQLFTARNVKSGVEYTPKQLTGSKLASIRSQLVRNLPNVSGDARQYVSEMVNVIDDIAKKNLAAEDISKLEIARKEWRNYKTLEPLLEKSTDGTINPTQLMQRVASSKYIKASRKGAGDDNLVDLARIGKQFMAKKGGSDTAQKLTYIKGLGAGLTGTAGILAPFKVIPAVLANTGYQALVNQSPKVVAKAIRGGGSNPSVIPIADMLAASTAGKITGTNGAIK